MGSDCRRREGTLFGRRRRRVFGNRAIGRATSLANISGIQKRQGTPSGLVQPNQGKYSIKSTGYLIGNLPNSEFVEKGAEAYAIDVGDQRKIDLLASR